MKLNPWGQITQMEHPMPLQHPLQMQRLVPPLGTLRPQTSTFAPQTGTNTTQQSHPYTTTNEKKDQRKRDLTAPTYSFSSEGTGRNNE